MRNSNFKGGYKDAEKLFFFLSNSKIVSSIT